jgi:methionine-rich copper-binding protein CopC
VIRPRRLLAGAAAVLAVALAAFVAARPPDPGRHVVTSTVPADGVTVGRPPTEVELSFTDPVDPGRSHVSVRDGSGSALDVGRLRLDMPEQVRQPVSIAVAGEVTVAYHVTFVDGAELAGTLRFSTGSGNADGDLAGAPPGNATHQHGIDPLSAALLVIDGLVALAVLLLLIRRPRPHATGSR